MSGQSSRIRQELIDAMGEISSSTEEWRAVYNLPPSFVGFNGHFPGRSITPAVVQMLMVDVIGRQVEPRLGSLREIVKARFREVIPPAVAIALEVQVKEEEERFLLTCRVFSKIGVVASKFVLRYSIKRGV